MISFYYIRQNPSVFLVVVVPVFVLLKTVFLFKPTVITKVEQERKNEMNFGSCSKRHRCISLLL